MMSNFALVKSNSVHNVIVADQAFADAIASDWDVVVDVDAIIPRPGIGWSYAAGVFSPPTPEPAYLRPQAGALGVFFEAYQENGYQWHYIVGPAVFNVADVTVASATQPSVAQAKSYVKTHATDEEFLAALDWAVKYRDRLVTSLTSAGVADLNTNARVVKLNNVIAVIGGML
jgi:hypothetical protein